MDISGFSLLPRQRGSVKGDCASLPKIVQYAGDVMEFARWNSEAQSMVTKSGHPRHE